MAKNIYLLDSLWDTVSEDQDPAVLADAHE